MKAVSTGFVLHRQNYRESSRILRCYTKDHGRVDLLCKGCRGAGRGARVLEPFRLYALSWSGRAELKTLTQADELKTFHLLHAPEKLYCGFYLNELLSHFTEIGETDDELFRLYASILQMLADAPASGVQPLLRRFELSLLQYAGYGITLTCEKDGVTPIDPEAGYEFDFEQGFSRAHNAHACLLHGDTILAMQTGQYSHDRQSREARAFMRRVFQHYLPGRTINARQLFS